MVLFHPTTSVFDNFKHQVVAPVSFRVQDWYKLCERRYANLKVQFIFVSSNPSISFKIAILQLPKWCTDWYSLKIKHCNTHSRWPAGNLCWGNLSVIHTSQCCQHSSPWSFPRQLDIPGHWSRRGGSQLSTLKTPCLSNPYEDIPVLVSVQTCVFRGEKYIK